MKEIKINAANKQPREVNRAVKQAAKENDRIIIETQIPCITY